MNLTDFLRARLAEATLTVGGRRAGRRFRLAETAAKARIIEEHASHGGYGTACQTCARWDDLGHDPWPCATLRLLALPYADHPDYDAAWRVDDDEG